MAARGEFAGGGKKICRGTLDLAGKPAPIEAVNRFDRHNFAQDFERPGSLRAGAAVSVAAQTLWFRSRRQAMARAGRERERDFVLPDGDFGKRLAEQVEFEICDWKFQIGRRQGQRICLFNIGVDQNQDGILVLRRIRGAAHKPASRAG